MVKKAILLLSAASCISGAAIAQHCATDEVQREYIKQYPQIAEIQKALNQTLRGSFLKTTATGADWQTAKEKEYQDEIATKLYVPVVVHVIHDYGTDNVPDTAIYRMIKNMNVVYSASNSDTSQVIEPFKKYIGNMNIEFRLAKKDPQGNPTNGITRHRSYLTAGGDDQAKMGGWDPSRYMNIWIERVIGRSPASGIIMAYATPPASGAAMPYTDGVIAAAPYINNSSKTIEHELGHYFNLSHTWGNGEITAQVCGDDEVDDTPETKGHFSTCPLYDTACALGYVKEYPFAKDSLSPVEQVIVDYPDTTNVQNIMDYSSCVHMFTKQQVLRARNSLKSDVAKRNNLVKDLTQSITGIMDPKQDIAPVADYSVEKATGLNAERTYFLCADGSKKFLFKNYSWRDTISAVQWEFSNNASPATSNAISGNVSVSVSEPGWVKVKITATGNNSGLSNTFEDAQVYAADPNAISPVGYMQDFNQNGDLDKWPIFNYFKNSNKWQVVNNTGYYDNTSIKYSGFDERAYPASLVGTPAGDYDDFFTRAFDLSSMTDGNCNLNFLYSGAFRTVSSDLMKDVLEIHYSTNCGETWVKMDSLKKTGLANKGTYDKKYAPLWQGDWELHSANIPTAARTSKTFFRFRYKATGDDSYIKKGIGNDFYMDRINISSFPLGVNTLVTDNGDVALAPNPATGNSFVVIKGSMNTTAQVQVTDMTGKVVYRTQQLLTDNISRIEIPASAIAVKGIYMVQVVTGSKSHTEKLVAY